MMKFRDENGSIVVEAAIVMPIFLLFIIFLISMIRITIVDISLTQAAHNLTKQVATHLYPVDYFLYRNSGKLGEVISGTQKVVWTKDQILEKKDEISNLVNKGKEYFNIDANPSKVLDEAWKEVEFYLEMQKNKVSNDIFTQLARNYVKDNPYIIADNLWAIEVDIPNLSPDTTGKNSEAYMGLTLKYTMNIPIPFMSKEIILTKRAYERAWIGL